MGYHPPARRWVNQRNGAGRPAEGRALALLFMYPIATATLASGYQPGGGGGGAYHDGGGA
jgi:hypothetical protein